MLVFGVSRADRYAYEFDFDPSWILTDMPSFPDQNLQRNQSRGECWKNTPKVAAFGHITIIFLSICYLTAKHPLLAAEVNWRLGGDIQNTMKSEWLGVILSGLEAKVQSLISF